MFKNVIKILVSVITVSIYSVSFADISGTYSIGTQQYTVNFEDSYQKALYETNFKPEIDSFYTLISSSGYTKRIKEIKLDGTKIEQLNLKDNSLLNPFSIGGKNLQFFFGKYNGNIDNVNDTSFITELVSKNIPNSASKNYQARTIVISKLNSTYNAVSFNPSGYLSGSHTKAGKSINDLYRSQLSLTDSFNYKLANELIDKLSKGRDRYLVPNSYLMNKTNLNGDSAIILNSINEDYPTNIKGTFLSLFTYNSSNNVPAADLTAVKTAFLQYQTSQSGSVIFNNGISGILDNGKKFNPFIRQELINRLNAVKSDILTNIEVLNDYETNTAFTGAIESGMNITGIVDTSLYGTGTTLTNNSMVSSISSFQDLTQSKIADLYRSELESQKIKDTKHLSTNKTFIGDEKTKLQTMLSTSSNGLAIYNNYVNNPNSINESSIIDTVMTDINSGNLDTLIESNLSPVFNKNTDPVNSIFTKLYKRHKILTMNNPLIGSEFMRSPIQIMVTSDTVYRDSLNGVQTTYNMNWRAANTITQTTENSNNKGISRVRFSFAPSPIVIKDANGNKIGVNVGKKTTYYLNSSTSFSIPRGDYKFSLYAINGNFNNVGLRIGSKYINLNGGMDISSDGIIRVTYLDNSSEKTFLPALWVKGIIK